MAEAATLLGRPYTLQGTVIHGHRRGGQLGYPTANLLPPEGRVLPPDGVYATQLTMDTQTWGAVTYIGTRPTFGEGARMIETYLLDGGRDLYGGRVAILLHERLRGDQAFESTDGLARPIAADVARTSTTAEGRAGVPARPPS